MNCERPRPKLSQAKAGRKAQERSLPEHDPSTKSAVDVVDRRDGGDRRMRLRERRSGFDRRHNGRTGLYALYDRTLLDYGKNALAFWTVLATIVVFNFLDLILTVRPIALGAGEANPVMRTLLWSNPIIAGVVKLGVVAAVVLALQRMRRFRDALAMSLGLLVGFTALMFYHAAFALELVG